MRVNFYATLRQIVGGKTVELSLGTSTTIHQLLLEIFNRYPEMEKELLDENGNLYGHVHIFINGRDVQFLQDMDSKISIDDKIDIFPAVGGGGQ
jgi:molybdopterin synthase sulfur carrier subunit